MISHVCKDSTTLGAKTKRLCDQRLPHVYKNASNVRSSELMLRRAVASSTKTIEYNKLMNKEMKWSNPYEYYYERGLYYHEIIPNLICGSQPRNKDDVREMRREIKVDTIINLQQDKDLAYWNVSLEDIKSECGAQNINFIRRPAQDFDPHSLRKTIPSAVKSLHQALSKGERVYVHCTAGLGRSPAVCIAYMYWSSPSRPFSFLDEAYGALTRMRPCGPSRDAIRGATYDILDSRRDFDLFEKLPKDAYATLGEKDRSRIFSVVMGSHSC